MERSGKVTWDQFSRDGELFMRRSDSPPFLSLPKASWTLLPSFPMSTLTALLYQCLTALSSGGSLTTDREQLAALISLLKAC